MGVEALAQIPDQENAIVHGSAVCLNDVGLLIVGKVGSGKSGLALSLMAFGARLIADDRVRLHRQGSQIIASAPHTIEGLIEARGLGVLRAAAAEPAQLRYVVDMDNSEARRLPEWRFIPVLGQSVPLLCGKGVPNLAAALLQLLKTERVPPEWPSET